MNKNELIEAISAKADITKTCAAKVLDAVTETIAAELKTGGSVQLVGFGAFTVKERAARTGRNPQTGESIELPASKNPVFKAGKLLKDSVN